MVERVQSFFSMLFALQWVGREQSGAIRVSKNSLWKTREPAGATNWVSHRLGWWWLRGFNHFFQCYLLSSGLGGSNQEQSGYRKIPFEKLGSQLELRIEFLIVWDDDGWEGSIIFFNVICSPVGWEGAIRSNQGIEKFPLKNSGASWSYELSFS